MIFSSCPYQLSVGVPSSLLRWLPARQVNAPYASASSPPPFLSGYSKRSPLTGATILLSSQSFHAYPAYACPACAISHRSCHPVPRTYTTVPTFSAFKVQSPDSCSAILCTQAFAITEPRPRPQSALPFALLFTGLFLLLSMKVLGRMEGFKGGRSVSTPRASSQFFLTCITFLLQTKSIKAPEIPL